MFRGYRKGRALINYFRKFLLVRKENRIKKKKTTTKNKNKKKTKKKNPPSFEPKP